VCGSNILFIYNILIFISKLCKQISFLLSKKIGRNLKISCDPLKGLLGENFQNFRQKRKLGENKRLSLLNILKMSCNPLRWFLGDFLKKGGRKIKTEFATFRLCGPTSSSQKNSRILENFILLIYSAVKPG
jgi:hypothetical protein